MEAMRQSWTDDRLDDFRGEVNRRFDEVYRRFDEVDRRFEEVDRQFDKVDKRFDKVELELHRINDRFDSLSRILIYAVFAFTSATLAGWAAVIALVLTQT